jgi:putative Ig domain-containing protein
MSHSSPRCLSASARAVRRSAAFRRIRLFPVPVVAVVLALCFARGAAIEAQVAPIATVGLTAGWVTFGQVVPKGFAVDGLKVGSLSTQTDVKTRWDDGSIRFAVVTVKADSAGDFAVSAGPASGAPFVPAIPTAAVTLTIAGVPYVAALPADPSGDVWLSGPNVYEGRAVVAPVSTGGAHPFLRVNFDTRSYRDGKSRVDISVENVLDQTGATTITYDVAVNIGGTNVWTKAAVQHYYLTRWRRVFEVGPSPFGSITPDIVPLNQARALPPYLPLVADVVDSLLTPQGTPRPTFDILKQGALNNPMWDHAGRPELAPYPDWTARYLVHRNPAQREYVLANGDLSGSWPFHIREPEGSATRGVGPDRFISLDQRPTVWLDDRANTDPIVKPEDRVKGGPMQMHEYGDGVPAAGQSPLGPDMAHQPSLAYVPYLLTGDRYYGEEMGFIANYDLIHTYDGDGVRSDTCATCPKIGRNGVLENNEVRGYGWALRNLVDAAAYAPNADTRTYFAQKVRNNLSWLDDYANGQDPIKNPLRILWTGFRPEFGFVSLWEQTYLAFAIDRANAQGFVGGLDHRDAIARLQLRLFTSEPAYPRLSDRGCVDPNNPNPTVRIPCDWSAPYLLAAGQVPVANSWNGFTFFTTLAEIAAHTVGNPDLQRPYEGFYGPEARLNLMIAIQKETLEPDGVWAGAQASYDYLYPFIGENKSACSIAFGGDGSADRSDLACRAGWAIDKYPAAVTPPPPPVNHAPVLDAIGDRNNEVGETVTLTAHATDQDGDTLTYSAAGFPGGLGIDAATGVVSGTLTNAGDFTVTVSASDANVSSSVSFTWHVTTPPPPNHVPSVTIGDQNNQVGDSVTVAVQAVDGDGDRLGYSASGLPPGAIVNFDSGVISGTLTTAGDFDVVVHVSDGTDVTHAPFRWHVAPAPPVNHAPALGAIGNRSDRVGDVIGFGITATDADGDALQFSATGLPGGVSINALTGAIGGSLTTAGDFIVTVRASDAVTFGEASFAWHVAAAEPPRVIKDLLNPGPQRNTERDRVMLLIRVVLNSPASLPPAGTIQFTAQNLPPGLQISRSTGLITGEIGRNAAGVYSTTVTVTENGTKPLSQAFQWTIVRRGNSGPKLQNVAVQTSKAGVAIAPLAIKATDRDGDALTFWAMGLPPGLQISRDGVISGTIASAARDEYLVMIMVSDGKAVRVDTVRWRVEPGQSKKGR